ncbi:MAG TPA: hypothetical protein VEV61_02600 [Streptosporangiaceae bacterium]|nr:hypothetical protein [Streptosporangiaceae bacterium]
MSTAAETYLRHLTRRAAEAVKPADLLTEPLRLQAVAQAFVIIGLVSAADAEMLLQTAAKALRAHGLADPQLGIQPEVLEYSQLRGRKADGMSWLPSSVAAGPFRLDVGAAELCIEWVRVADAGIRFQVEAKAKGTALRDRHVGLVLADMSLADDAGTSYQMYWDRGSGDRALWVGDVLGLPGPPAEVSWLELRVTGSSESRRFHLLPPRPINTGKTEPPWPTVAETYLAQLCAAIPPMAIDRSRGRDVAAAVAEALLCAGAMPANSALLPDLFGRDKRSWHPVLPTTWPTPVRRATPPERRFATCAKLPFSNAVSIIEGISAWSEDVQVHVYGWPWLLGDGWPTIIPSFRLRALDDLGCEHEGRLGDWYEYGAGEARGDFTLWPTVPRNVRRLHLLVSTLSEAASADIDLPPTDQWLL